MEKSRFIKWLFAIMVSVLALLFVYIFIRVLICDSFVVKGHSMEPVLYEGDRVYVNKLKMGARIYLDFNFSNTSLSSFRLPGFSTLTVGDIVVVNYPYSLSEDTISFKINLVYIKRCYGSAGDTVRIVNGYYVNPHTGGRIGDLSYQNVLSIMPDSVLLDSGVTFNTFRPDTASEWTIRNFGPMYVPRKGYTIKIDGDNYMLWQRQVLYETGDRFENKNGVIYLRNKPICSYTFKNNWYFLGGDNVLNSRDSRYFGLVPEEYIVGIVASGGKKSADSLE